ncbi:[PSI+] inducibility protein 3 [[Candida] anglica]|uniref:[PSI+] inducibility protein 3 n=1 Tax=[Candida] anglica TaxID=148631 RepID=A0ABP0E7X0_9ASCO
MATPLINRSLTTIRTELEFLVDSEVITAELHEKLVAALPAKYQKDMAPWGADKLTSGAAVAKGSTDLLSQGLGNVRLSEKNSYPDASAGFERPTSPPPAPAPVRAPAPVQRKPVGYCKALFAYNGSEADDISLLKGDRIAVLENLSEDWWKGYRKGESPQSAGVFPSNYVTMISQQEFDGESYIDRPSPANPEKEKAQYNPQDLGPPPPQYGQAPLVNQPSYGSQGSYAQFPPPSTNYYGPPQQQYYQPPAQQYQPAPQQEQAQAEAPPQGQSHLRKFGGKLGNAAIFGAGATIGSDIVNSIF